MLITSPYVGFSPTIYRNTRDYTSYKRMLQTDTCVSAAYDLVRRGVANRVGHYNHPDPKVVDYITNYVMPAISNASRSILSCIFWGASVSELVRKPVNNLVKLERIYTASPELWWSTDAFVENNNHELEAVKTTTGTYNIKDEAGIQQIAVCTYRNEYCDYYGFASATQVYPYWYIKSRLLQAFAIYMEKYATPTALFKTDTNDEQRIQTQYKNLGTDAVMVVGAETEFDLIESSHAAGDEYIKSFELLDGYILLAFYIPKLMLSEGQYSSRAQSSVHLEVYRNAEYDLVVDYTNFLISQIITPMIQLNFGPQESYGELSILPVDEPTELERIEILKGLKDLGMVSTDYKEQVAWIADKFDIPLPE